MRQRIVKKITEKAVVFTLCAALSAGGMGHPLHAAAAPEEQAVLKEETVYVLTDESGNVDKIIVSDWLHNPSGESTITDRSELTNVKNVKGEEGFTEEEGNTKVWAAQGNDIYYQGNLDKELPVGISVTYTLDGKEMPYEELAGKSGKVTIRYEYTNRQYEYAQINGVRTKIYVPFVALTGILLDDDMFSNVEISRGKLINDGGMTVAVGIAFPGLEESLGLATDTLDIPDSLEIRADVQNFESGTAFTLVTNEIFSDVGMDGVDSQEDLKSLLADLSDAMNQLTEGSSRLYEGLDTLLGKSGDLETGIDELASGAAQLNTGAGDLDNGAAKLQEGTAALQSGLNTLVANNDSLNSGARQVFDTLLAAAQAQLSAQLSSAGVDVPGMTIDNYGDVLNDIMNSLDGAAYQQALAAVTAEVEKNRPSVEAAVTAAVREQVIAQVTDTVREQVTQAVLASMGLTQEDLADETVKSQVEAAVSGQLAGMQTQIDAAVDAQMQSDAVMALIASSTEAKVQELISQSMQTDPRVQEALAAASEGVKAVASLKASLDSYNAFYCGLQSYTAGVAQAAAGAGSLKGGADELRNGTGKLSSGAAQLYAGMQELLSSIPALKDGITQLRDGAAELTEGLKEFDEKAVQKLVDAVDGDLDSLTERLRAMSEASKHYQSFSGKGDDMDGQVKFIYRTDRMEEKK